MTEWILIGFAVVGGILVATHTAAVAFVLSRVVLSGRKQLKQFSPQLDHPAYD
ncbi:MAG: hypothetical protein QOJ72_782 [Nocardioidaceae bacterium]|jgi:uncharacterized protein (DUF3084 family)|nr:hypothetical protein [Nocardioidaceae bacterium]